MIKYETFLKNPLNISFLDLPEEFPKDSKNEYESATVNESSVFELLY